MASKLRSSSRQLQCYSIWLLLLVIIMSLNQLLFVQAQFFTKSSKSIPRMGRRSASDGAPPMDSYRRQLIDNLVDVYGPDLLEKLEMKANGDTSASGMMHRNFDHSSSAPITNYGNEEVQFYQMDPLLVDDYATIDESAPQQTKPINSFARNDQSSKSAMTTQRLLQYLISTGNQHPSSSGISFERSNNNEAASNKMNKPKQHHLGQNFDK